MRFANHMSQLFDGQPFPGSMNHAMTIGADKSEVVDVGLAG